MLTNAQQFFEAMMLVCFGASWPFAIMRTYKAKTAKGKSFIFLSLLILGYIAGMVSKLWLDELPWVFFFYLMNLIMVSTDLTLCVRYCMRDQRISLNV